jgi:acetyl esterase/lipase
MDDAGFDMWCPRLRYIGVSVEYRLAPETPYPGPLDDCYAALRWTFAHAGEFGIDTTRIGIRGASAGGGSAAALALLARDRGDVAVAFQQLIYPMIDDRQTTPSSAWEVPIWNPAANTLGWRAYLGDLYGAQDVPAYAAAARAMDLSGLPPAFVSVGTLDGFCDEDITYAQRLNHAGVPVELHVYPGAPHGFDMLAAGAEISKRARRDQRDWLQHQLHPSK